MLGRTQQDPTLTLTRHSLLRGSLLTIKIQPWTHTSLPAESVDVAWWKTINNHILSSILQEPVFRTKTSKKNPRKAWRNVNSQRKICWRDCRCGFFPRFYSFMYTNKTQPLRQRTIKKIEKKQSLSSTRGNTWYWKWWRVLSSSTFLDVTDGEATIVFVLLVVVPSWKKEEPVLLSLWEKQANKMGLAKAVRCRGLQMRDASSSLQTSGVDARVRSSRKGKNYPADRLALDSSTSNIGCGCGEPKTKNDDQRKTGEKKITRDTILASSYLHSSTCTK